MIQRCLYCKRDFGPGVNWHGVNFCRAAALLPFIELHPNLSAWELSQQTKLSYAEVTKGITKAREYNALEFDEEERDQGGKRYRYRVAPYWLDVVSKWETAGLV